ncbi:sigma-54-dependent Fis family transcriptional regulator [Cupriavidus sp. USMAHM13]|uniref:sigma-54-dependent transcriptional regulator n=1 Tax=Cupriavidus sp. USMAHM13 TaxID=1389192 RepID=UPI0008A69BD6|nr:sigma-54 dependent transcriptional regulator [Cupriavidus sp. USMAHM13]AOY99408.1 sigma-54-dependent Fis family transcriptional regulator [Cupriavidus sp. USMAHM13]
MAHVLIVDDDEATREVLEQVVTDEGLSVASTGSLRDAAVHIERKMPDALLADLQLPDGSGLELISKIDRACADVIVTTGYADVETAIDAMRFGVADYLVKPIDLCYLRTLLARIAGKPRPARCADSPAAAPEQAWQAEQAGFGSMVGTSEAMLRMYETMRRVAPTDVSVLLIGESGTGKELVARTLHELSLQRGAPFLAVNCAAISPLLLESEFFGHERGSFTGANRRHDGYFAQAEGGTLFLDEITEMPAELQVKLLRTLESGTYMRVGGQQEYRANVRIISATNRDPCQAIAENRLRADLFHRLSVFPIMMPPLRERGDDVVMLAEAVLEQLNSRYGSHRRFGSAALDALRRHAWPGNVRELRNVVQRAYIMADRDVVDEITLPPPCAAPSPRDRSTVSFRIGCSIAEAEMQLIFATLAACKGVKNHTASMLGVSLKTLYNRLEYYRARGELPSWLQEGCARRGADS